MELSTKDIRYCQKIMAKCGPTYYWATRLLPRTVREATYALYAFYRVPDDIVDLEQDNKSEKLKAWIDDWNSLISAPTQNNLKKANPVFRVNYQIHKSYSIPHKYSGAFLNAMLQDLTKSRYASYQELEDYMFGSAAVPGIMMTYLVKPNPDKLTLEQAKDLGLAMQLTNFFRDIKEDIEERNRIYLPLEELQKFKIDQSDIINQIYPENWQSFMCFQLQRANKLYESGFEGLKKLPFHTRFCVKLSAVMYMDFQRQIIQSNFKVYDSTYKLSTVRKIWCLIKTIFNLTTPPKCPKQ